MERGGSVFLKKHILEKDALHLQFLSSGGAYVQANIDLVTLKSTIQPLLIMFLWLHSLDPG